MLKISQGFNGFIIRLMVSELDGFLTLKAINKRCVCDKNSIYLCQNGLL
ncbi:hypothetical protein HMPREF0650_1839 [Hoylesella buccalis ATCC 35310]|uniref:Uncharacterized protein n=1 Tax=Hoylesella buccalis ATCC 35310 TaxID=679190 RepID=D1W6J7_9BACT|nr:hypothetical protein HMPREF0650_1839 [Hoylesella buccalis ATCC 35310]